MSTPAVTVGLVDPRYPHNVGAAVRAASCFGADRVLFTGTRVSVTASKGERLPREERMKGYRDVHLQPVRRLFDHADGLVPVAVELRPNAELLPDFVHPERAMYVFGPEDGSLTGVDLRHCHRFVVIPTRHCVNLAAAVYLVLYDRLVKRQAAGLEPVRPPASILDEARGFLEHEPETLLA